MAMVLRSMYLDPKIDAELGARAEVEGTTKAELMRRFLVEGLARPATMFAGYAAPDAKDARSSRPAVPTTRDASRGTASGPTVPPRAAPRPMPTVPTARSASAEKKKPRINAPAARRDASR